MKNVPNEDDISPAITVTVTQLLLPKTLIEHNSSTVTREDIKRLSGEID